MIAVDTNVLIRTLTNDDADQAARALAAMKAAETAGESVLVNDVVLVETLWTLGRSYRAGKDRLIDVVQALLDAPLFALENPDEVSRALKLFIDTSADFADCMIAVRNQAKGARCTLSFDRRFSGLPAAQLL